eukprot:gnl/TRDRNA2_/TRDRNA2_94775_c0_seq1.p1 gnl/TRDRNA2_/TRDRNA2_94775_c0~~gnl/TRDRNA2_/TRDRNA2_94775_c0_seq1.p1  ORF type:complete len:499 (+),score=87.31 gnl/TRDRNA2_/TRDRNA2_94775_c0_seq1:95-1591(+)
MKSCRVGACDPHGRRHLLLNMDINKTVLMTDHIQGKTSEQVVNEVLANTAWGRRSGDGSQWLLGVDEPTVLRPTEDGDEEWLSHAEYVAELHPGRANCGVRNSLNGSFTSEGGPGAKLANHARKMLDALKMPDGTDVMLIPAFFEMMLSLKREKRSFTLCFRTFGDDIPSVSEELNAFCEGRHPRYPGVCMDGSDGEPDYRLYPERCGTFYRDDDNISIVMGTTEQPGEGQYKHVEPSLSFFDSLHGTQRVTGSVHTVYDYLQASFSRPGTIGLRDYFAYWKRKGMTSSGGKILFMNPTRESNVHELFFDDNIRYSDAYIVNPIDVYEPERKLLITRLLETHLCRCEPLEALSDFEYFVNNVARLERGYERKLVVRERFAEVLQKVRALRRENSLGWAALKEGNMLPEVLPPPMAREVSALDDPEYDPWQGFVRNDRRLSLPHCGMSEYDWDAIDEEIRLVASRRRSNNRSRPDDDVDDGLSDDGLGEGPPVGKRATY